MRKQRQNYRQFPCRRVFPRTAYPTAANVLTSSGSLQFWAQDLAALLQYRQNHWY